MQGLDVENKDWVSCRISSTVNLLLLVSQRLCHFSEQMETQGNRGKSRYWNYSSMAAAESKSVCGANRNDMEAGQNGAHTGFQQKTNTFRDETVTFILAAQPFFPLMPISVKFYIFRSHLKPANLYFRSKRPTVPSGSLTLGAFGVEAAQCSARCVTGWERLWATLISLIRAPLDVVENDIKYFLPFQ